MPSAPKNAARAPTRASFKGRASAENHHSPTISNPTAIRRVKTPRRRAASLREQGITSPATGSSNRASRASIMVLAPAPRHTTRQPADPHAPGERGRARGCLPKGQSAAPAPIVGLGSPPRKGGPGTPEEGIRQRVAGRLTLPRKFTTKRLPPVPGLQFAPAADDGSDDQIRDSEEDSH